MDRLRQVANAPSCPVMLYDRDCRFCALWIRRWRRLTGDAVDYVPLQDARVGLLYPELSRAGLEAAVHFIDAGGALYRGAEAVVRALAQNPSWRWVLRAYQSFPGMARAAECGYRFVAGHRSLFSWLTRMF